MFRLSAYPLVHLLMLIAGFGTIIMLVSSRSSGRSMSLPMLSAFGALAAATGEGTALVLLLLAALGLAVLDLRGAEGEDGIAAGAAPWPVFCALVGIGRSLETGQLVLLVVCLLPALWSVRHRTLLPAFARGERGMVAVMQAVLLLVGLWSAVSGLASGDGVAAMMGMGRIIRSGERVALSHYHLDAEQWCAMLSAPGATLPLISCWADDARAYVLLLEGIVRFWRVGRWKSGVILRRPRVLRGGMG